MVKRECVDCGTIFNTYPSKIKDGKGKYCSRACSDKHTLIPKGHSIGIDTTFKPGRKPHNFKGWRLTQSRPGGPTYKEIFKPEHPNANKSGYVREHRLIMEAHIGRYLGPSEIVHHKDDKDTLNNDLSNLELMLKKDHDRLNTPLNIHRRWNSGN